MSIELFKLTDPRVDGAMVEAAHHDAVVGSSSVVVSRLPAISYSSSNVDWVIQTPGLGVYTSRRVEVEATMLVEVKVTIAVAANAGTGDVEHQIVRYGSDFITNSYPFNSCISSSNVQINSSQITTQNAQIMPILRRVLAAKATRRKLGVMPNREPYALYCDDDSKVFSSPWNGVNNTPDCEDSMASGTQGSFKFTSCVLDTAVTGLTASVSNGRALVTVAASTTAKSGTFTLKGELKIREPLFAQPFTHFEDETAFINVQSATVRLNMLQASDKLCRLLKFVTTSGMAMSAITYAFNTSNPFKESPNLRITYMSPPAATPVPRQVVYPYHQYTPLSNPETSATIPAGTTETLYSNTITLNTCPDFVAVYVALSEEGTRKETQHQGLAAISGVSITWNNQASLLNTFQIEDLWRRSLENGINAPLPVFSGEALVCAGGVAVAGTAAYKPTVGAPLILAMGRDIPLEPGVGPGVAGIYTLKLEVKALHYDALLARKMTLVVVPINSQYIRLMEGGTAELISSVATESQLLEAPIAPERTITAKSALVGGAWGMPKMFTSASSAASAASNFANRAKGAFDTAKDYHSQAKKFIADHDVKGKLAQYGGETGTSLANTLGSVGLGAYASGMYDAQGKGGKRMRQL